MTTSDPNEAVELSQQSLDQLASAATGNNQVLDIQSLTKLANEFFRALPGEEVANSDVLELQRSANQIVGSNGSVLPGTNSGFVQPATKSSSTLPATSTSASNLSAANSTYGHGQSIHDFVNADGVLKSGHPAGSLPNTTVLPAAAPAGVLSAGAPAGVMPVAGLSGAPSGLSSYDPSAFSNNDFSDSFSFLNDVRPFADTLSEMAESMSGFQSGYSRSLSKDFNLQGSDRNLSEWQKQANPLFPGTESLQTSAISYLDTVGQNQIVNVIPTLEALDYTKHDPLKMGFQGGFFDVESIRRDFPILNEVVNGHKLVWLDNAATTQKPQAVIDRLSYFYTHENSNIHRSAHELAARSSDAYDASRESVKRFINASSASEIVFVRGATEGINLVAQSWGRQNIQKDDEIVISWLEHHANIVPWQMLCAEKGARLKVAPVDDRGDLILEEFERLLGPNTKLVSITQVSNALGTVTPVDKIVQAAHRHGAKVLIDGAQAISHMRIDVQQYDCDFYVFSGHKVFAPTGIGVVYAKQEVLDGMRPWQGGGNMIHDVTFERTIYQPAPAKFEAGTGNIADAIGLGAAINYLERIGMDNVAKHEHELLEYGTHGMKSIPGLRLIGTAPNKAGVLSFVLDGFKTEQVSSALNQQGIAEKPATTARNQFLDDLA